MNLPHYSHRARHTETLIAAGLAEKLRVIAVDLRGRGLSDKPSSGYSLRDHVSDLLGLLDADGGEVHGSFLSGGDVPGAHARPNFFMR